MRREELECLSVAARALPPVCCQQMLADVDSGLDRCQHGVEDHVPGVAVTDQEIPGRPRPVPVPVLQGRGKLREIREETFPVEGHEIPASTDSANGRRLGAKSRYADTTQAS